MGPNIWIAPGVYIFQRLEKGFDFQKEMTDFKDEN